MAFTLKRVKGMARSTSLNWQVAGVITHDGLNLPVALRLSKKAQDLTILIHVACESEDERAVLQRLAEFIKIRNVLTSSVAGRITMTFRLVARSRAFKDCLSVVDHTMTSLDHALSN